MLLSSSIIKICAITHPSIALYDTKYNRIRQGMQPD